MRPGREYDVTCARTHPDLLDAVDHLSTDGRFVLAGLGYEGEDRRLVTPYKQKTVPRRKGSARRKKVALSEAHNVISTLHARPWFRAEQNAGLKVTFEALRHVSLDPLARRGRRRRSGAAALAARPHHVTKRHHRAATEKGSMHDVTGHSLLQFNLDCRRSH